MNLIPSLSRLKFLFLLTHSFQKSLIIKGFRSIIIFLNLFLLIVQIVVVLNFIVLNFISSNIYVCLSRFQNYKWLLNWLSFLRTIVLSPVNIRINLLISFLNFFMIFSPFLYNSSFFRFFLNLFSSSHWSCFR